MKKYLVYALDYVQSSRLYIGKSSSGLERPRQHSRERTLKKIKTPTSHWIQKHKTNTGADPIIIVLEECSSTKELSDAECFYIAYFRSLGVPLLNLTDGGDGMAGHKQSEETKKKRSAALTGRTVSVETRKKIVESNRKHYSVSEIRAQSATYAKRRTYTAEAAEKAAIKLRGRCSETQRETLKIGRANRAASRDTADRAVKKHLGAGVLFSQWRHEQRLTLNQAAKLLESSASALSRFEKRERARFPLMQRPLMLRPQFSSPEEESRHFRNMRKGKFPRIRINLLYEAHVR